MRRDREFETFVLARSPALRRMAYLMCGDWHLAEDALQDAFIKLYVAWPNVARDGRENAYVRQIVVRTLIDQHRRPWRRERATADLPDSAVVSTSGHESSSLNQALALLPVRQRTVLVLRFWEDLSVQQVAHELGVAEGTVKSQTARGLERLRSVIGEQNQFEGTRNE
ncbi:MAG TPA: SigE family RNA polymerase sigma factor [Actinomycetes bacterium]|nr:SigE family RNA polymerase sigma factor [Actinomycetes bacterium]